jgi:hypothetical protein
MTSKDSAHFERRKQIRKKEMTPLYLFALSVVVPFFVFFVSRVGVPFRLFDDERRLSILLLIGGYFIYGKSGPVQEVFGIFRI